MMRPFRWLPITLWCYLLASSVSEAQPRRAASEDGKIVQQARCAMHEQTYASYVRDAETGVRRQLDETEASFRAVASPSRTDTVEYEGRKRELLAVRPVPQARFDAAYHNGRYECARIRYLSDGLEVVGFIYRPTDARGKQLPVIIFNRGGNGEFSKLTETSLLRFQSFLDSGFVVIGSQYRGNDGGQGREEFGGSDVRDVLNLIPLVRSLEYADTSNIFLWGHSRGGTMTYQALRKGMPVNAAVVGAGPVDLANTLQERPVMERVYAELMPDYARRKAEHLEQRSAIRWAERLNRPLLILHGTADWRVNPAAALQMATRLQALGKEYSLVMYAGDDHALSRNRTDVDRRIMEWFRAHSRASH